MWCVLFVSVCLSHCPPGLTSGEGSPHDNLKTGLISRLSPGVVHQSPTIFSESASRENEESTNWTPGLVSPFNENSFDCGLIARIPDCQLIGGSISSSAATFLPTCRLSLPVAEQCDKWCRVVRRLNQVQRFSDGDTNFLLPNPPLPLPPGCQLGPNGGKCSCT